ncbi:MAG TPA: AI-2E family transporter [Pirellulaceae bacterium]|nr:AI-2E family transporter [Pirellulaceae bacterium]
MNELEQNSETTERSSKQHPRWPLMVLAVLAILAGLYFARDVLVPVAFAVMLTLLLSPLLRKLRRWRIPDLLSALLLVAGTAAIFVLGVALLAGQAQYWLAEAPVTVRKVRDLLPSGLGPLSDLAATTDAVQSITNDGAAERPVKVEIQSWDLTLTVVGESSHFVASALITFVLAFFLLAFSDTLLRQAASSCASFNEKRNVVELIYNIENGVSRYLRTVTLINIGLGIVAGLALWMLGVPNPLLWGVMVAILNFVPHVGAFVCLVVLFFVGAVTRESITYGLLCAGIFVVLTSVESYFVTPICLSKSLQLSPLAVILAILFWGWLWGVAGGLMAAPLLAIVKIACDQFEPLRAWSAILAGVPTLKAPQQQEIPVNRAASVA